MKLSLPAGSFYITELEFSDQDSLKSVTITSLSFYHHFKFITSLFCKYPNNATSALIQIFFP